MSVSRETSSEGTSISISRLVLVAVSVGLTGRLSKSSLVVRRWSFAEDLDESLSCQAFNRQRWAFSQRPTTSFSLWWRIITVAAANFQPSVLSQDFNRAVPAIVLKVCRTIRQCILAPQIVLNLSEGVRDVVELKRPEGASPGRIGNPLHDLVEFARIPRAREICADRVDDHVGPQCHFNRFLARCMAGIVIAVTDQNDGAADRPSLRRSQ